VNDLTTKAKVIADLLDKGAEEVSISGTDIKVTRTEYRELLKNSSKGHSQTVNINVNAQAVATASSDINANIDTIIQHYGDSGVNEKQLTEIKRELNALKRELAKTKPS